MPTVYIALGSNVGDRPALIEDAIQRLGRVMRITARSSLYETEPVGYLDQPTFLNAVIAGTTDLEPLPLLHDLQRIERELGRERPFPNAPRTIDLDLLLYDDLTLDTPQLTLPHPRLHERFFVLVPLAEIAPALRHPRLGRSVEGLLRALGPPTGIRRLGSGAQ